MPSSPPPENPRAAKKAKITSEPEAQAEAFVLDPDAPPLPPDDDKGKAPAKPEENEDNTDSSTSPEDAEQTPDVTGDGSTPAPPSAAVFANGDWQAIYDPQSGRYYFLNALTKVTTWENPLEPPAPKDTPPPTATHPAHGEVDPELAYLDPTIRTRDSKGNLTAPTFAARFNAKSGRFEGDPTFDPSRVSEYARSRTQAGAYFDVEGWERSLESSGGRLAGTSKDVRAQEIRDGKKLSKDEVARFRARKQEKKAQKQRAWLME